MDDSLELFQFIKQFYQIVGIYSSQSNQKYCSINSRNSILLFSFVQFLIPTVAFLFFKAESILDYGQSFFILVSTIESVVLYAILIWQMQNILKFIENCKGFIEKRE